jgi:DNA-binding NarL/FixJ family response regulator
MNADKKVLIIDSDQASLNKLIDATQFALRDRQIIHFSTLIGLDKVLTSHQFDLVIVGINQINDKKFEQIKAIKISQSNAMIVVASKFEQIDQIITGLKQGIDGYILKNEPYASLVKIIRETEQGIPPMSPLVTRKIILSFYQPAPTKVTTKSKLTNREHQVLQKLGQGCSNKAIAEALGISAYTVADYVKSIYAKLKLKSRAQAIRYYMNNEQFKNEQLNSAIAI